MPSSPTDVTFDPASGRLQEGGAGGRVYLPWPTLTAFTLDATGTRPRAFKPKVDLQEWQAHEARARFLAGIPEGVVDVVARFPARHWELLVFVAQCGAGALDLLDANPALGFMVGNTRAFRRTPGTEPMVAARLLLMSGRSQREILTWLGFPGTETVRRIVRKIEHRALTFPLLRALRRQIGDATCQQRLVHLPRITKTVLILAGDGTLHLLSPALLRRLAEREVRGASALPRLLADTNRMWRQVHEGQSPPPFASLARLRLEHDRLATTVNWAEVQGSREDVARSPLPGNESILPLDTLALLVEEGQAQRNCVASYAARVRRGECFIYRVLTPTRATLSVVKRAGRWRIDALEGPANARVPAKTRAAVQEWLDTSQPPSGRKVS